MKTRFYLLLASLLSANMYAADPESFPTSDAIWNISVDDREYRLFGLSGDTIIKNKLYNKLYYLNDTTLNIDSGDEYCGGFRLEGKNGAFRLLSGYADTVTVSADGINDLFLNGGALGDLYIHNFYAYKIHTKRYLQGIFGLNMEIQKIVISVNSL